MSAPYTEAAHVACCQELHEARTVIRLILVKAIMKTEHRVHTRLRGSDPLPDTISLGSSAHYFSNTKSMLMTSTTDWSGVAASVKSLRERQADQRLGDM